MIKLDENGRGTKEYRKTRKVTNKRAAKARAINRQRSN